MLRTFLNIQNGSTFDKSLTRNLPNGYVVTADGVQETELNAQIKLSSAKCEK